jgi:succinoglycan biosynthesis protein ExoA
MRPDDVGSGQIPDVAVLCVIPCLDEAKHLEGLITQLLDGGGGLKLKIVVVDGGSTDDSQAIVRRCAARDSRVFLLENDKRIQSAAVNKAVEEHGADAEFLIRVDAHAEYPARYCEGLLAVQRQMHADAVVVSMRAEGRTCFQNAVAAAQNSVLGNGGTPHRNETTGRWVDHGHHALVRMSAYKALGGYDETFFWNEDAEFDVRMRASGFRIYLAGTLSIAYFPRTSIVALFRQYFNYGRGRASNFLKHHERLRVRQMLPLAVGPALAILPLILIWPWVAMPALAWSVGCMTYGFYLGLRLGQPCALASGLTAIVMHTGWSLGFYAGFFEKWMRAMKARPGGDARVTSSFR